ncbi:hypothetical protein GCM10027404_06550 [Arthrobacter tumbae]|uniref:hypothetical protein n=1 Tax=Arthrobacter tumbae TaxID=163874 RepID=UPI00195B984E|nr:hypothetical protein [Arthrobacter tumbae]MBM7779901.1 hypothetical protein [Arthrobacter tumbae]
MDAQLRSFIEPLLPSSEDSAVNAPAWTETDDDFPLDLSSVPEDRLAQLCDALFLELDSETPDLRAMERYQAACDELMIRQLNSGVA